MTLNKSNINNEKLPIAIIIEDQPAIWEYAKACLAGLCEIKAFCSNTKEAEEAFHKYNPDFVWLDCYLGEISEIGQGLKNSGILISAWIKKHKPQTKIFLFTASNELNIYELAKQIEIDGIALGGKFIKDKNIIVEGIKEVLKGREWISPNLIEDAELESLGRVTIFEFCVICSMLLGKKTSQIADELDTTRKRVNNAIYRVKEKLEIDEDLKREDFLEILKDKIKDSFNPNEHYKVSDVLSINLIMEKYLDPVIQMVKSGELNRVNLQSLNDN